MKSEKSVPEIEMEELLKESEDIVDDSYLKTQEARRILDAGYKMLEQCKRLRISRDNHASKREEMKKQRDLRVSDKKLEQLMVKVFKMGKEKYECRDYPMKLWIRGVIEEINIPKKK